MTPPPPGPKLPPSLVIALGLTAACKDKVNACLDYAVCLQYAYYQTGDTQDTGTTTQNPAEVPPTTAPPAPPEADIIDRVLESGVLPDDVAARLQALLDRS